MKNLVLLCFALLALVSNVYNQSSSIEYGNNPEAGHYAQVNGVKMYHEIYGSGTPLLLIHGNGGSIKGHSNRIEYFKDNYKVIAVDSRSHGKSADVGDSLTYKLMTQDYNALLDYLNIDSCLIWGQSDGGIIGLRMAIDYPDKVKKVAAFGANTMPDSTAVFESIIQWVHKTLEETTDPLERKLFTLLKNHPHITYDELAQIKAPVLIMSGDRDAIKLEHTIDIFNHIETANLFIMPGATHFGAYEKTDLFNKVLEDFFTQAFSTKSTVDIFK